MLTVETTLTNDLMSYRKNQKCFGRGVKDIELSWGRWTITKSLLKSCISGMLFIWFTINYVD